MSRFADDVDVSTHPTQETRVLRAGSHDVFLRKHGWQIAERKTGREPRWLDRKTGEVCEEHEALLRIREAKEKPDG